MAKKLPRYRLQPVFEQRERRKDEATKALVAAREALEAEKQRLVTMQQAREELAKKREQTVEDFMQRLLGGDMQRVGEARQQHDYYLEVLDQEAQRMDAAIVQQHQAIARAEQGVVKAQEALLHAATELKAMEKHKEKWAAELKAEWDRKEQEVQEELGQVMWLQQRRDARRRSED